MHWSFMNILCLISLMASGCTSFYYNDRSNLNFNAPSIAKNRTAPTKGTYVGYLQSLDKKSKFPLILELIEHHLGERKGTRLKLIAKISLAWGSPVYQTIVWEGLKYSTKRKQIFSKQEIQGVKMLRLKYSDYGFLSGNFKIENTSLAFETIWTDRAAEEHDFVGDLETIFPTATETRIGNIAIANECPIEESKASINFIKTAVFRDNEVFSGYNITINRNNLRMEAEEKASYTPAKAKLNLPTSSLEFEGGAKKCRITGNVIDCARCQYVSNQLATGRSINNSTAKLPVFDPNNAKPQKARGGIYSGYAHVEEQNLFLPIRLKIDPKSKQAILTTFFGSPDDKEYVTFSLDRQSRAFRRSSLLTGETDIMLQISWTSRSSIHGIAYSRHSGRIGRFVVDRKELLTNISRQDIIGRVGGFFMSPIGALEIVATSGASRNKLDASPLIINVRGTSLKSAKPEILNNSFYDFNYGKIYISGNDFGNNALRQKRHRLELGSIHYDRVLTKRTANFITD